MVIKKILVTILLVFVPILFNNLYSTCIIIYIGNREIILAADSRNLTKGYKSDSLIKSETCKIQKVGSFFCAMAGLTNSEYYQFKPYDIVKDNFKKNKQFEIVLKNIKTDLKNKLIDILKRIKTNPVSWKMVVTSENRVLDLVLVGMVNNELTVYRVGFVLTNSDTIQIDITEESIVSNNQSDKYIGFGDSKEAAKYLKENLRKDRPEVLMEKAINEQSKKTITVGGSINLIKIKPTTHVWIKKNNCGK